MEYNAVVENILRDKESGWAYDYYRDDGKTSVDVPIARALGTTCTKDVDLDADTLQYKKFIEVKRFQLLQNVRNTFIVNGDLEYLVREVKQVEEYIASLR